MRNDITLAGPYLLKRIKSISSANNSSIIKYKMGWFDDLFKDTNNEADDDNEIEHTSAKNKRVPILEPKQSVRTMNKLRKTIKRPQFRLPPPSVIMTQQRFSYIR